MLPARRDSTAAAWHFSWPTSRADGGAAVGVLYGGQEYVRGSGVTRTSCGHDRNPSVQRPFPCCREQGGLPDTSLAANDEGAAPVLDSVDQRVELGQVSIASEEQPRPGGDSFGIWSRSAHAHPSRSRPLDRRLQPAMTAESLPVRSRLAAGARELCDTIRCR